MKTVFGVKLFENSPPTPPSLVNSPCRLSYVLSFVSCWFDLYSRAYILIRCLHVLCEVYYYWEHRFARSARFGSRLPAKQASSVRATGVARPKLPTNQIKPWGAQTMLPRSMHMLPDNKTLTTEHAAIRCQYYFTSSHSWNPAIEASPKTRKERYEYRICVGFLIDWHLHTKV